MKDSRGPLAVVAGVVVIGLLLIWTASTREEVAEPVLVGSVAPSPVLLPAAQASVQTAPPSSAKRPAAQAHDNQVFVCGIGWVDRLEDGALKEVTAEGVAAIDLARRQLIGRLSSDASPLARAAAIQVEDISDAAEPSPALEASSDAAAALWRQQRIRHAERLAQLAVSSTDPRVYGLAVRTCKSDPVVASSAHCASLSLQQWARLDPQEAQSWLYALDEAVARNDQLAIADSLFHIGSAAHWKEGMFEAVGEVVRLAGQSDAELAAAMQVSTEVIGIAAAQTTPYRTLTVACRMPALADADRHQLCDRAAETMTQRSDAMIVAMIGSSVARNVGWPAERIDAIRGLTQAMRESIPMQRFFDCRETKALLSRFARQSEIGEIGYAREWMAATGRSIDTYARKERDRRLPGEAADHERPR